MVNNIDSGIRAVLFDLSGTTLDEGYIRHGLAALSAQIGTQWCIDSSDVRARFLPTMRAVSSEYAPRAFYRMSDVVCDVLSRIITDLGGSASRDELLELEQCMWAAAIPSAVAADDAIETLTLLRDAGIRTGIVSYADTPVFRGLLDQSGLAGLTDIELCSEDAGSCKPHVGIFRQALVAVGTTAANAIFVGDSIEADIVGGNRAGMRTMLLSGREFNLATHLMVEPEAQPTHRIHNLLDVANFTLGRMFRPTRISA